MHLLTFGRCIPEYPEGVTLSIFVIIICLLGGLALFLFGIALMGDGLNKVAGSKLQVVLYKMTNNRFKGILLGTGVTALIQSSSATSIMAIGFVNSGLMQFRQAVSIILGSILGTSITGWIVSLSYIGETSGWLQLLSATLITSVFAIIGIIFYKFSKKPSSNHLGSILLGFAVLMFGMSAMSTAVSPLQENEGFISLLTKFSNPFLGILVGMIFTAIIQSSAAAVGILQSLSLAGILPFSACYPIILGIAIGGALPVLISSLGATLAARRTAMVHLISDIFGAVFCGVVFYAVNAIHPFSFMEASMTPVTVALVNTIFRLVTVIVLAPGIGILERLVNKIMPEKDTQESKMDETWGLLETRFINIPSLAIEQSRIVIKSMAGCVRDNYVKAINLLSAYSEDEFNEAEELEDLVDQYEDKLGTYLVKVSSSEMTVKQNEDLYQFLHAVTDLERISDLSTNIAESAKTMHDEKIKLSDSAVSELKVLGEAVDEVTRLALSVLTDANLDAAYKVEPLEELIDNLCDEIKHNHIDRIQKGICTWDHGFVFGELLTNFERISDHCSNIAVAKIELNHESFDTHNYIESITKGKNVQFVEYYKMFSEIYKL